MRMTGGGLLLRGPVGSLARSNEEETYDAHAS
jgi:hypothetical protein